jgi:hypothetical protein
MTDRRSAAGGHVCTAQLDGQQVTYTVKQNDEQGNVHIQGSGLVVVDKIEQTLAERSRSWPSARAASTSSSAARAHVPLRREHRGPERHARRHRDRDERRGRVDFS